MAFEGGECEAVGDMPAIMSQRDGNKGSETNGTPRVSAPREGWSLALLTGILLAGTLLFYFFDPATSGGFWVCPFHRLTGWYCPGCGGQRALHELLHGHFTAALRLNPFAVLVFFPVAGYSYAVYALRVLGLAQFPGIAVRGWMVMALLVTIILFGLFRNFWGLMP
jgi:hypothetical protein